MRADKCNPDKCARVGSNLLIKMGWPGQRRGGENGREGGGGSNEPQVRGRQSLLNELRGK